MDSTVPRWAREAVWYQIFVERFRNGDPGNDPLPEDTAGSWPHLEADGWEVTPWGWDWYRQEEWAKATGKDFYTTVQMRRYGGDLQGVLDQLDYLERLGVTALYLNPINDAPSLHKYDARHYSHVDRNFGPTPRADAEIIGRETPEDPATWEWTGADRLFLELISQAHRRGIRVVLDYSWNHTGITFWAWRDVLERQQQSPFRDWYQITSFDDPSTPANEFEYRGWAGVATLPNLTKVGVPEDYHGGAVEGNLHPEVKQHVFAVTRRWLDPDGDGDPSDGLDGFRLDVAEMVPLGFWRDYRRFVRSINPEAYLVGEVWWEQWPDRMLDPAPWLAGDVFDAVMNYRWYAPTRSFFAQAPEPIGAAEYRRSLEEIARGLSLDRQQAMMNLTASHDSPRVSTSLANRTRYKYRVNPRENPDYQLHRPGEQTRRVQKMVLVQQFTYLGAPHVWNGDELGMWGADDPDNRKPLIWPDLEFEDERAHPFGKERPADPVRADLELRDFYARLIELRRRLPELWVDGELVWLTAGPDEPDLLAYSRRGPHREALVVFNRSSESRRLELEGTAYARYADALEGGELEAAGGTLPVPLEGMQARILLSQ